MTSFYPASTGSAALQQPAANLLHRKPVRVTFTSCWSLHQSLQKRADAEGRSLSNLIAHLLENSVNS